MKGKKTVMYIYWLLSNNKPTEMIPKIMLPEVTPARATIQTLHSHHSKSCCSR